MNCIEKLKQEHEKIERELLELETIIGEDEINYSNLLHVIKKLYELWNSHEIKEEKVFSILEKERIKMPVKTMLFEHKQLKPHKIALEKAINSGNNQDVKDVLNSHAKTIITQLRNHINSEDEILYTIALSEFTKQEIKELESCLNE